MKDRALRNVRGGDAPSIGSVRLPPSLVGDADDQAALPRAGWR